MEKSNDGFTAQLCRIKAFLPSSAYTKQAANGNKTRNELGKERAAALNNNVGWEELLGSLNSSVDYEGQKIQFEPCNLEDDKIFFDHKSQAIKFPKLKYSLGNGCEETLSIRINPCVSKEVHTKILTRPTFICTTEEFLRSPNKVDNFFKESVNFTEKVFDVIKGFYAVKMGTSYGSVTLEPYCSAEIFVIGYKAFKQWLEVTMESEKAQILECAKKEHTVELARDLLNRLKEDGEDYKWFSRSKGGTNAVYGIYGKETYCKVLGIADDSPGLITKDLTYDIAALMDSNGNC